MGVTLAYALARAGRAVTVYEASPVLGGLAGPLTLPDGVEVDRFYHAILSSDDHLGQLCEELGIADQLRFRAARSAVFSGGHIHPMNGVVDFLRFPPLRLSGRLRLGWTVVAAHRVRRWQDLEHVKMTEWLRRLGGDHVFDRFWGPMLDAKFDGAVGDTPATWMWARLVRTRSTRKGVAQREECGHLVGGYKTLLQAMAARIVAGGGHVRLSTPVTRVEVREGRARGVQADGHLVEHEGVVVTAQAPVAARLVPDLPDDFRARLTSQRYLGIVCPLFVLDRPLTGIWTLNIADRSSALTGVIETTTYIDPRLVGGHHLVYAPKYVAPGSPWLTASDAEIETRWRRELTHLVPGFDPSSVRHCLVHRERFVEPLHESGGGARTLPVDTPVAGLHLATTSQIYPALTNGESVTRHANAIASRLLRGGTA